MSSSGNIEDLLQRYLDGETDLREEQQIAEYFQKGGSVPGKFKALAAMFAGFEKMREQRLENPSFEQKLDTLFIKNRVRKLFLWGVTGVAAAVLLFFALKTGLDTGTGTASPAGTEISPQSAFANAKKALLLASYNLNKGLKPAAEASAAVQSGISKTEQIDKINLAVTELRHIHKTASATRWLKVFGTAQTKKENY